MLEGSPSLPHGLRRHSLLRGEGLRERGGVDAVARALLQVLDHRLQLGHLVRDTRRFGPLMNTRGDSGHL